MTKTDCKKKKTIVAEILQNCARMPMYSGIGGGKEEAQEWTLASAAPTGPGRVVHLARRAHDGPLAGVAALELPGMVANLGESREICACVAYWLFLPLPNLDNFLLEKGRHQNSKIEIPSC